MDEQGRVYQYAMTAWPTRLPERAMVLLACGHIRPATWTEAEGDALFYCKRCTREVASITESRQGDDGER